MKIVALGQQKGGVGKSAAAINLACQGVAAGLKVAIIDMDAEQATTTKWGKRRSGIEQPFVEAADAVSLHGILAKHRAAGVDWVFIDLPGRSAPIASAGLVAADFILVPCRPLDIDIEASVPTVQAARRANKAYAYLMNIAPPQIAAKRAQQVAGTLAALGHKVAPQIIIQRIAVPDAIAGGKAANEAEPHGKSAAEFKELFDWLKGEVQ